MYFYNIYLPKLVCYTVTTAPGAGALHRSNDFDIEDDEA